MLDTADASLGPDALAVAGRLIEAIEAGDAAYAKTGDIDLARRLLQWRRRAGSEAVSDARDPGPLPPAANPFPDLKPGEAPEIAAKDLTAEVLRGALQHHGHLLVRGLFEREDAERLAADLDKALDTFVAELKDGSIKTLPWFERFMTVEDYERLSEHRIWIAYEGFSVLSIDSPSIFADLVRLYWRRLLPVVEQHFGERPVIAAEKSTLRRMPPDGLFGWHQDGAVLELDTRAVNVWMALSECGEDAPGLEFVPMKLDRLAPQGTPGAGLDWCVARDVVDQIRRDTPLVAPKFRAGDALLFDQFSLHRGQIEPGMTRPRWSVETWFFAPSHFPAGFLPMRF